MVEKSYTLERINCIPGAMLEEMLSVISGNLPMAHQNGNVITRAKFVLTELVTNAIKHAQTDTTNIKVQLSENNLKFIKTDKGNRFTAGDKPNVNGKGAVITTDIMHTLYAVNEADRLRFYCEEHPEPMIDFETDLPEHFGLLIITKASDDFYYNYNMQLGSNTFCVTINL